MLEGVAWARQVDGGLWETLGGHTLPLLKDLGFSQRKGLQGPGWVVPGLRGDVICWVSQAGTRLS